MTSSERYFSRAGSLAAGAALVIYALSSVLHPGTPPHQTEAAFAEYAAEAGWAPVHLMELLAILLMCAAAIALAWRLRRNVAGVWATLAGAATVAFASIYAVFIAVDGVALGVMVDRWAQAAPDQQGALFETAFAVRQIEAGLFGIQWLVFGIAAALFAAAFFASRETSARRKWLRGMGWLSALSAIGAISFGIAQAQSGFTETSMAFQTGLLPGFVWIAAVAVFLYRHPEDGRRLDEATWTQHDEQREGRSISDAMTGAAR